MWATRQSTASGELWYVPGDTNSYNWSYTATTTAGKGGKTTYSNEFAVEEKFQGSFFWQTVQYDLTQSTKFTWQDQWNNLSTNMSGEQAKVQIVGPPTYNGCPEEYNVFQDNVYGTFMVAPVQ